MVKVSVVMPVYNTEDFLRDSIDSILNQSLSDVELICVDDGSDDSSLDILNEYVNEDDRVSVFSLNHQGAGNARNYALDYVSGEYLYFMDADDILYLNALEDFYNICKSKNLDFLLFKLINYDVEKGYYYESEYYNMSKISNFVKDDVFNFQDLGDLIFSINSSTCSKFYNTEFVINSGAKFRENSKFNDNQFFWEVLFNAKRIYFVDGFYYTRTRHSKSLTGSGNKNHVDIIGVVNDIFDLFIKYNQLDNFKKILYNKRITWIIPRYDQIQDEFKEFFYSEMKKDFKNLEYDDFYGMLSSDKRFVFESVLVSKNVNDFNLLKEYYSIIHEHLSVDDEVSRINKWYNSLDNFYRSYFFKDIKFRFKRYKENLNTNSDFYNHVMDSNSFLEFTFNCNIKNINDIFDELFTINNSLKEIIPNKKVQDVVSYKLSNEISALDELYEILDSEIQFLFTEYKNYLNDLEKNEKVIFEKDSLISDLNDEIKTLKLALKETK